MRLIPMPTPAVRRETCWALQEAARLTKRASECALRGEAVEVRRLMLQASELVNTTARSMRPFIPPDVEPIPDPEPAVTGNEVLDA